jgi:hypothetical protein
MKETRIILEYGKIAEISRITENSVVTVRKALRGDKSVQDYSKIRKCALEKGGVQMREVESNN